MSDFQEAAFLQALFLQTAIEQQTHFLLDEEEGQRESALTVFLEDLSHMFTNPTEFVTAYLPEDGLGIDSAEIGAEVFYRALLRSLARFTSECPFENVRVALRQFLTEASAATKKQYPRAISDLRIPRGWMDLGRASPIPEPNLGVSDTEVVRAVFLREGRFSNIDRLLAWHPVFLEKYSLALHTTLHQPGPLTLPWRHFICIMAACRHENSYLLELHIRQYIKARGDLKWLRGLDHCPQKMQNIGKLNALLAHQPWLITTSHIEELLKGPHSWSMVELVQALILMATVHSQCGLVTGLSIKPEPDSELVERPKDHSVDMSKRSKAAAEHEKMWNEFLAKEMDKRLPRKADVSPEELSLQFAQATVSESETESQPQGGPVTPSPRHNMMVKLRGVQHSLTHSDFEVKSTEYHVFRSQAFSWGENAYYAARHVLQDTADALNAEFTHIMDMTDSTINNVATASTEPFRHAVWYYTHRVYGILHDDYRYDQLNNLLPRKLKHFVKRVAIKSAEANVSQLQDIDIDLQPREQVHIVLLITEARKQAELLYGLRAIMEYKLEE